jgi:hypothetical protein
MRSVAIEERLREELQAAQVAFDSSTVQFKRIIKHCKKLRLRSNRKHGFQPTEEHVTVKESLLIHREAIVQYRQAFEKLNNFILYGQLPELPEGYILERSPPEERRG